MTANPEQVQHTRTVAVFEYSALFARPNTVLNDKAGKCGVQAAVLLQ